MSNVGRHNHSRSRGSLQSGSLSIMKVREIVIFSGEQFTVPQCIQRIDSKATHGWQVRYHGTKMFSDHTADGSGASQSLAKATRELLNRIAALPAPVSLQRSPSANKTSNLPSGISGPILRKRKRSKVSTAYLSVLLPQHSELCLIRGPLLPFPRPCPIAPADREVVPCDCELLVLIHSQDQGRSRIV